MKDRAFRPPEERYDDTVLRRVIAWVGVGALVAAAGVVAVMVTADGEEVAPPPSADPSVALPAAVDAGFLLTGEIDLPSGRGVLGDRNRLLWHGPVFARGPRWPGCLAHRQPNLRRGDHR